MAWVALAAAAVSAFGAIQQGNAASASYKAQAQASEYNAKIQEDNAARISREASIKEDNLRRQQAYFLGRQRAAIAESGVGLGSGSALDIQQDSETQAELDALTVRYEGETQRRAFLQDASLQRYEGSVARMNASEAKKAGYIGAVGSMLGGVGRYYNSTNAPTASRLPWQAPGNVRPSYMGGGYY